MIAVGNSLRVSWGTWGGRFTKNDSAVRISVATSVAGCCNCRFRICVMADVSVLLVVTEVTLNNSTININIYGGGRRLVHTVRGAVDAVALLFHLPFSAAG